MNNVEIDGIEYHTDFFGNLILYEDGEPIPASVCICCAYSESECMCGAWDMDDGRS